MATVTASEVNPLRAQHNAENVVRSRYQGVISVSDVVLLARIPNRAVLTGWHLSGGTGGISTGTWSLGFASTVVDPITGASFASNGLHPAISLTSSGFADSFGQSGIGTPRCAPTQISLSDQNNPQWVWVQASPLGSLTASTTSSLNFIVRYMTTGS